MKCVNNFSDLLNGKSATQSNMAYFQNANAVAIGNKKSMKDWVRIVTRGMKDELPSMSAFHYADSDEVRN